MIAHRARRIAPPRFESDYLRVAKELATLCENLTGRLASVEERLSAIQSLQADLTERLPAKYERVGTLLRSIKLSQKKAAARPKARSELLMSRIIVLKAEKFALVKYIRKVEALHNLDSADEPRRCRARGAAKTNL